MLHVYLRSSRANTNLGNSSFTNLLFFVQCRPHPICSRCILTRLSYWYVSLKVSMQCSCLPETTWSLTRLCVVCHSGLQSATHNSRTIDAIRSAQTLVLQNFLKLVLDAMPFEKARQYFAIQYDMQYARPEQMKRAGRRERKEGQSRPQDPRWLPQQGETPSPWLVHVVWSAPSLETQISSLSIASLTELFLPLQSFIWRIWVSYLKASRGKKQFRCAIWKAHRFYDG